MSEKLRRTVAAVSTHMDAIRALFIPEVRVTLIVRTPGFDGRDFMLSEDELDEVIALIERRRAGSTNA